METCILENLKAIKEMVNELNIKKMNKCKRLSIVMVNSKGNGNQETKRIKNLKMKKKIMNNLEKNLMHVLLFFKDSKN